jgi:hypothetical protein
LGVPNLNDWLPEHLAYLKTYMPKRSMNLLFPISVTVPTLIVVLMVSRALSPGASEFEVVSLILVASLLALGILEHWFLVLPLPDEALWAWALPSRDDREPGGEPNKTWAGRAFRWTRSPENGPSRNLLRRNRLAVAGSLRGARRSGAPITELP